MNNTNEQLLPLLEKLCEGRLTADDRHQIENLVRSDRNALQTYLDYVDLHGSLHWDTAHGLETEYVPHRTASTRRGSAVTRTAATTPRPAATGRRRSVAVVIAVMLSAITVLLTRPDAPRDTSGNNLTDQAPPPSAQPSPQPSPQTTPRQPSAKVVLQALNTPAPKSAPSDNNRPNHRSPEPPQVAAPDSGTGNPNLSPAPQPQIVAFINQELQRGWTANQIEPSATAEDTEWIRRVYLDIVGHIPTATQVQQFVSDRRRDKRSRLIDSLLDDPDYVRNFTTIWSNLLVGRSPNADVSKPALQAFLSDGFRRNRPWKDIVFDLVAAEGSAESNGATNFLLAHLNNQAVPATAITAQLFMGCQIQCTQCHAHPFNNATQAEFWGLNSFFKQTTRKERFKLDTASGKRIRTVELVSETKGGPTYYETRRGLMQVAYPQYFTEKVNAAASVNRRQALGRLMTSGDKPRVAESIVNRMWQHFLGHAFTHNVADMGPHAPVTHPQLLDRLAREFVRSDYDLKQLTRWICNADVYSMTSEFSSSNQADDPSTGNQPLFSRTYLKQMSAEQLFDSLVIATRANRTVDKTKRDGRDDRDNWIQQFVFDLDTDENDEFTAFSGTISQALMMMNGELIERAIGNRRGTFLQHVVSQPQSDREKIRMLCLSALSRYPTQDEQAAFSNFVRKNASVGGFQDIFWAYLNSSEFILIH